MASQSTARASSRAGCSRRRERESESLRLSVCTSQLACQRERHKEYKEREDEWEDESHTPYTLAAAISRMARCVREASAPRRENSLAECVSAGLLRFDYLVIKVESPRPSSKTSALCDLVLRVVALEQPWPGTTADGDQQFAATNAGAADRPARERQTRSFCIAV